MINRMESAIAIVTLFLIFSIVLMIAIRLSRK